MGNLGSGWSGNECLKYPSRQLPSWYPLCNNIPWPCPLLLATVFCLPRRVVIGMRQGDNFYLRSWARAFVPGFC